MSGARATYEATTPGYVDEAEVRTELSRTFDVCGACRACVDHCGVFPTLFDLLDGTSDGSAGSLTPDEQDRVVDQCFVCNRCRSGCPYSTAALAAAQPAVPRPVGDHVAQPPTHERVRDEQHTGEPVTTETHLDEAPMDRPVMDDTVLDEAHTDELVTDEPIDVPRLVVRTRAMYAATGRRRVGEAVVAGRRARADAMRLLAHEPMHRSSQRWSPMRLRLPRAGDRFSRWFARRDTAVEGGEPRSRIVLVPTCLVEYQEPHLGRDTVDLLEHHGASCTTADVDCCGAPWLHAGDLRRFARMAEENVRLLDAALGRSDEDVADAIVVVEPTCRQVIAQSYVDHVGAEWREAARRVAARVSDPVSYVVSSIGDSADVVDGCGSGDSADVVDGCGSGDSADVVDGCGSGGGADVVDGCGSGRGADIDTSDAADTTDTGTGLRADDRTARSAGDRHVGPSDEETLQHVGAERLRVVVHMACHDTDGAAQSAVDYLRRLGCDVTAVEGCAGIGGAWDGLDATTVEVRLADGRTGGGLVAGVDRAGSDGPATSTTPPVTAIGGRADDPTGRGTDDAPGSDAPTEPALIVGGCGLANEVLAAGTGAVVEHPVSLIARLCGARPARTSI